MELEEEQAGAVEQVQRASTVSSEWQPARSRLWDYHYACSYSVKRRTRGISHMQLRLYACQLHPGLVRFTKA